MAEDKLILPSVLRIPFLDDEYEAANKERTAFIGKTMSEDDKDAVGSVEQALVAIEEDIKQIQEETIKLLIRKGSKCLRKYLTSPDWDTLD